MLIHKREGKNPPRFQVPRKQICSKFKKKNQSQSELEKGFPLNCPSIHSAIDKDAEKVQGGGLGGTSSWGLCHQMNSPRPLPTGFPAITPETATLISLSSVWHTTAQMLAKEEKKNPHELIIPSNQRFSFFWASSILVFVLATDQPHLQS